MAVRDVVDYLAYRPALVPLRCVELLGRETGHDRSQIGRRRGNLFDPLFPLVLVGLPLVPELSNRIPDLVQLCG
jgi:hypothetical protein